MKPISNNGMDTAALVVDMNTKYVAEDGVSNYSPQTQQRVFISPWARLLDAAKGTLRDIERRDEEWRDMPWKQKVFFTFINGDRVYSTMLLGGAVTFVYFIAGILFATRRHITEQPAPNARNSDVQKIRAGLVDIKTICDRLI